MFVRMRGAWFKVLEIGPIDTDSTARGYATSYRALLVNRHGHRWPEIYKPWSPIVVWTPGDSREDERRPGS